MGSPAGRPNRSNNNDICVTPIRYRIKPKINYALNSLKLNHLHKSKYIFNRNLHLQSHDEGVV